MHTLNPYRVGLLIKQRFLLHGHKVLMYTGIVLGFMFLSSLVANRGPDVDSWFFDGWFAVLLFAGGFIWTVQSLPELLTADGRQSYFTLPASDTEKWFVFWLLTGPVLLIGLSLTYSLLTLIVNWILALCNLGTVTHFELFTEEQGKMAMAYLFAVHPTAVLGRIVFNTYAFAKTQAIQFVGLIATVALAALTIRVVYREHFDGLFSIVDQTRGINIGDQGFNFFDSIWQIALFGVLLLAASYFRFHEKEV